MKVLHVSILILLTAALAACNVTKHVPPGETLYAGSRVHVSGTDKKKEAKNLKGELAGLIRPKPNSSLLGIRFKLWFYYVATDSSKGLRRFIRNKLGEPPVYTSMVNI